jgi:hypothetical protein
MEDANRFLGVAGTRHVRGTTIQIREFVEMVELFFVECLRYERVRPTLSEVIF